MDLEYVKEFVTLAKIQNFMEAADSLYISQSSLSKHIQSLETELGVQLFERSSRNVYLNKNGEIFLTYANRMLKAYDECRTTFQNIEKENSNSLSIVSIPMMAQYGITEKISRFQRTNPDVGINLSEGTYYEMLQLLREHKCDFAFVREGDENIEEFRHILISKDHLVAVLPKNHPLAARQHIRLEELKDEYLLLPRKETRIYSICTKACRKAKFEPKISSISSLGVDTYMDLVKNGMGVALLMQRSVQPALDDEVVMTEITPYVETSVYLLYDKKKKLNRAAQKFVSMFSDEELPVSEDQ